MPSLYKTRTAIEAPRLNSVRAAHTSPRHFPTRTGSAGEPVLYSGYISRTNLHRGNCDGPALPMYARSVRTYSVSPCPKPIHDEIDFRCAASLVDAHSMRYSYGLLLQRSWRVWLMPGRLQARACRKGEPRRANAGDCAIKRD